MTPPGAAAGPGVDADVEVGVIGLGIMGSCYARHLLAAGFGVAGFDTAPARREAFAAAGGALCDTSGEVIARAPVVVTALSSIDAFRQIMLDEGGAASSARAGQVFVETGTLPIALKEAARQRLADRGAEMIDAPVTGTRVHAERRELVMYASGSEAALADVRPLLEAFARDVRHVGPFGAGMKLKLITNHLVAVHNVAAAEALALAGRAGLDLQSVYDLIAGGPASSGVFGFRGPMMIADCYEPATMRLDVFDKDLEIIGDFAAGLDAATPLLDASTAVYRSALAQGLQSQDVAATFRILRAGT